MSLSDTLRNAVLASGLSQRQIEEETNLGRGLLARFLSGERDIQLSTADRLADYFGLTLAPADATNKLVLHVLSEVRHMTEKARDSAVSTVEELDALRRCLSLTQSGSVMGVEMEIPQGFITQPRKMGRPKLTISGVRDTDLIKSTPSGSAGGDTVANNPLSRKEDSAKTSQSEDETSPPPLPDRFVMIELKTPPDPPRNVSTGPTRRHAVTEMDVRTLPDSPAAPGAKTGEPASTKCFKTHPKGKKKEDGVG